VINSGGRRYRKGFSTTNRSKIAACAKLKTLVENQTLKIFSKPLISELKTFIAHGGSYAAKIGETDDLVMSTILIVRMLTTLQDYHPELSKQITDHSENFIEPLPFISMIT